MVRVWSDVPPQEDQRTPTPRHTPSDPRRPHPRHLERVASVLDGIARMTLIASLCGLALLVIYLVVAAYLTWG